MEQQVITAEESRAFRRLRLIWLGIFLVLVPLIVLPVKFAWLPALLLAVAYFVVGFMVVFWPCPRCGRFYCLRFGLVSIAWPWVNHCLHCDSVLEKDPGSKPSTTVRR